MPLQLRNTLTQKKEPFKPADPDHARIYICGPTVYDYAHLGHARCYVVYDVLVRHLRESGMKVTYVRNITDVDDKILKRSKEAGEAPETLSARFTKAYHEDMARLGNLEPDVEPKVSEHLTDIVELIETLIDKGHAYAAGGDVYFDVQSFPGYGKLSHRKLDQLAAGASGRLDQQEAKRKKHPADFALWKKSEADEPGWDSAWGRGRPGWHIECSAMSMRYLGETFDLHGGGQDLVFPHHENEIAQSEAATGKTFATCWMHNGFVEVDKEKMSKSLGNFFTARRVEYLYATHERLASIPEKRIVDGGDAPKELARFPEALRQALDDDLNMPVALARTAELLKSVNELVDQASAKKGKAARAAVEAAERAFEALDRSLGLGHQDATEVLTRIRDRRARQRGLSPATVEEKIAARTEARKQKDFAAADGIRDELAALGVELHDSPDGTTWTMH